MTRFANACSIEIVFAFNVMYPENINTFFSDRATSFVKIFYTELLIWIGES